MSVYECLVQRKTSTYSAALGQNVRAVRARLGIRQAQCAARMRALGFDWHQQTVGNIERANRRMTAEEILGLSFALECTFVDLLAPGADIGTVALPSGEELSALSVRRLTTAINDGAVRWADDDKPIVRQGPPPSLRSEDVRASLDEMNTVLEEARRRVQDQQQGGEE